MYQRHILIWCHDLLMAAVAFFVTSKLSLAYQFEGLLSSFNQQFLFIGYLLISGSAFLLFGLYRSIWRFTSLPDVARVFLASILVVSFFACYTLVTIPNSGIGLRFIAILAILLPNMLIAPRIAFRLLKENRIKKAYKSPSNDGCEFVLLLGASSGAEVFIRANKYNRFSKMTVVGIIDDKEGRFGRHIRHVPVLGSLQYLPDIVDALAKKERRPTRLVLTKPVKAYAPQDIQIAMDVANRCNLLMGRLPSVTELEKMSDKPSGMVLPIAVEELLGRPEVSLNNDEVMALVNRRRILVTGAGGTIGSELVRQIASLSPRKLIMIDNGEYNLYAINHEIRSRFPQLDVETVLADVRDFKRVTDIFIDHRPEIVFHAAALKHVPLVEENMREAVLTNVMGTQNVAAASIHVRAQAMVMISTDKAINPTSVMGSTKRVAEMHCQALDVVKQNVTRFVTVRFGNVLGSSGSVIPLFQKQLEAGGPLTVTHPDITRYFMTVREAVSLVLQASAHGAESEAKRGKIFVLDMGQPIKIIDLARQMIRLAGLRPDEDIKIEITGLRPGEKLYEELFSTLELVDAGIKDILIASPQALDMSTLNEKIAHLVALARECESDDLLIEAIAALVPEYQRSSTGGAILSVVRA